MNDSLSTSVELVNEGRRFHAELRVRQGRIDPQLAAQADERVFEAKDGSPGRGASSPMRNGFNRAMFPNDHPVVKRQRLKPLLQKRTFTLSLSRIFAAFAIAIASTVTNAAMPDGFPSSVSQGAMVIGKVPPGSQVRYANRTLLITPDGEVVFGIGRDEKGPATVEVLAPQSKSERIEIAVEPREWPVERVDGVPPKTVEPPPDIAARIKREQARVVAARTRNDARGNFLQHFQWPVDGRISGRFGSQRVYNGIPKSPHPGMDIAVPQGTPVKAPASGIITFAEPDLYLTGGTVLLDHGHGVSSNFLHMSRIDVKVGDSVRQGQVIGAVGMTGRATGPHLHWGMNWFDVRMDPLLLVPPRT